jgi:hypothetical protein
MDDELRTGSKVATFAGPQQQTNGNENSRVIKILIRDRAGRNVQSPNADNATKQ